MILAPAGRSAHRATTLMTMSIRRMSIALLAAAAVWLPSVHFFYRPSPGEITSGLEERALAMWSERAELDEAIAAMRRTNAEWDFMSRTYLVLAFANSALSKPERRDEYLSAIDAIIDETLAIERSEGMHFFLMNYSKSSPFVVDPARSVQRTVGVDMQEEPEIACSSCARTC